MDRRPAPGGRDARLDEQWILGFMSGVADGVLLHGFDPMRRIDANAVWSWMDNYCAAHPLDNFASAGHAFVREHPR